MSTVGNIARSANIANMNKTLLNNLKAKNEQMAKVSAAPTVKVPKSESKKETKKSKKRIDYSYKRNSSLIVRAKTSTNASGIAVKIRACLLNLYRKRLSKDYDQEELEAAIAHARSLERIAKRKASNLSMEEKAENYLKRNEEFEAEEEAEESLISNEDEGSELDKMSGALYETVSDIFTDENMMKLSEEELMKIAEEAFDDIMDTFDENMKLSEELSELSENPYDIKDSAKLSDVKRKHRCAEMKELVKADCIYLKSMISKAARELAVTKSLGTGDSGGANVGQGIDIQV